MPTLEVILLSYLITMSLPLTVTLPNSSSLVSSPRTTARPTTRSPSQSKVLLYTARGYKYYKVPVRNGTRLEEGRVAEACAEAGLEAVCSGPASCKYSDTDKCHVTPLSTNCNNPM